jgi:hypothetical protein
VDVDVFALLAELDLRGLEARIEDELIKQPQVMM